MSPRTGRPRLEDGVRKDFRFEVRLNKEQNDLLTSLSEKYGLTKVDTILKALELLAEQSK